MINKVNYYLYKSNQFPTLPTIYTTLMQVMSNPRSSIKDIVNVIINDQSSVTKLLQIVNSPIYGFRSKIVSINQAIMFIGFNEVRNALLTLAILDIYGAISKNSKFNVVELWKYSIATGIISKIIGERVGITSTENFFVSGIIHNIGKLFFIYFFNDEYIDVVEKVKLQRLPITKVEEEVFGVNHCYVGVELAKKWNLPLVLINVIENYSKGRNDGKTDTLLSSVHLASIITKLMQLGDSGESYIRQPEFEVWNVINLPKGSFLGMYDSIIASYQQAGGILQLK